MTDLAPLPINVRPRLGETTGHYIQRLAHANHLKPSYLLQHLTAPPRHKTGGKPQLSRLAAVSGRTESTLARTLADAALAPAPAGPTASVLRLQRHPALHVKGFNTIALVKQDARQNRDSLRQIAAMWQVPAWLLTRVLSPCFPDPLPAGRSMMTDDIRRKIEDHHAQGLPPMQAWQDLLDKQDIWIALTTVTRLFNQLAHTPRDTHGYASGRFS